MVESSPAVEYQNSQVGLFMAGINRDLDEHLTSQSAKYAFDFEHEKPHNTTEGDFEWFEVSNFSKSEVTGKKPRMQMQHDRKSTADTTLHSIQPDILSPRGGLDSSQVQLFQNRYSSFVSSVSHYHAQQASAP